MKKVYIIGGIILAAGVGFGIYKYVTGQAKEKEKATKAEADRLEANKLALKIKDDMTGYMKYDNPYIQGMVKKMRELGYTYDQKTSKAVKI